MAHQIPHASARSLQNFSEISELLRQGTLLEPSTENYAEVVRRGLEKKAPLHQDKNSVADALLIEQYTSVLTADNGKCDEYVFATSNHTDFSTPKGDRRKPHPDLEHLFQPENSHYVYDVDSLVKLLGEKLGSDYLDEAEEVEFIQSEMPTRPLADIIAAQEEYFDKIWYGRSLIHEDETRPEISESLKRRILEARRRVEEKYAPEELPPVSDWEWGFMHGKLSALRWVLGDEWDFLDT